MSGDIRDYALSVQARERLQRRTLAAVVLSQLFGGAGLAAGVTVGALLAENMMGTERFAGLPSAAVTLGAAAAVTTFPHNFSDSGPSRNWTSAQALDRRA